MSEQELARQAKHRLAVIRHAQEVTGNAAHTATISASPARPTIGCIAAMRRKGWPACGIAPCAR